MPNTQTYDAPTRSKVDTTTRTPRQHLAELARKALKDAEDNQEYARLLVLAELEADPKLQKSLLDEIVTAAVTDVVGTSFRANRSLQFNAVERELRRRAEDPTPKATPEEVTRFILLEVVLGTSNVKLRDARKAQLEKEASFQLKMGRKLLIKQAWLSAVADALPDTAATVGDALTEARLRELYDEARKRHADED